MTAGAAPLRRNLVVLATSRYDSPEWPNLDRIDHEVQVVTGWLCDDGLGARRFTHQMPELSSNPTHDQVMTAVRAGAERWTAGDAVFMFVTGHGHVPADSGVHYVVLQATEPKRLHLTAIVTADLVKMLTETHVQHMFLVLDMCHAGKIASQVSALVPELPEGWVVLPSAPADEQALQGALSDAIAEFLTDLADERVFERELGFADEYIPIETFLEHVKQKLRVRRLSPLYGSRVSGAHYCLPNPHWRDPAAEAVAVARQRRDLALRPEDLTTHWGPRARGVLVDDDRSWLFTGREALMEDLVAAAVGEPGTVVVAGGAGTGKSAVLARLVTLSDPLFRAEWAARLTDIPAAMLPRAESVDVAILAKGRDADAVVDQLCGAMPVPAPAVARPTAKDWMDSWQDWITHRQQPVTVVLDALDESATAADLVREVIARIQPESGPPRVRLIIGVRSVPPATNGVDSIEQDYLRKIEQALDSLRPRRIEVDQSPWWRQEDVAEYVGDVLRNTPNSPYADGYPAEDCARLADTVAERAERSFLLARIAAANLAARRAAVRPDDDELHAAFDDGLVGLFREDLRRTFADEGDRRRAVAVLRAVAFAQGKGLPWQQVWPAMVTATSLDGRAYGDSDIEWLLDSRLSGYLVRDAEDGVIVYRLFHDLLRRPLRDEPDRLLAP